MTNDDLLMIANRNLRVLDTVAHKLLAVDAKTERAILEASVQAIVSKAEGSKPLIEELRFCVPSTEAEKSRHGR